NREGILHANEGPGTDQLLILARGAGYPSQCYAFMKTLARRLLNIVLVAGDHFISRQIAPKKRNCRGHHSLVATLKDARIYSGELATRCVVPKCRGISHADATFREALWDRFFT